MRCGLQRVGDVVPRLRALASCSSKSRSVRMSVSERRLQQAIVRCPDHDDKLSISLSLAGRVRNLDRPKSEALEKALGRLHTNAMPKPDKRSKRKNPTTAVPAQQDLFVGLYSDATVESALVDKDISNQEAWQHGRLLVVGQQQYLIELNPPIVDKVDLPCLPMVGYPICPIPTLLFAEDHLCQWHWYRSTTAQMSGKVSSQASNQSTATSTAAAGNIEGFEAIPAASSRLYVPTSSDEGHQLRVQCTPASRDSEGGLRVGAPCCADTGPVQNGPALTAAAHRHPLTPHPLTGPGLRVVTYNILADQYASREHSQTKLFGYCPKQFLDPDYRRPLILQELLGFHADIICLQEMDEKAFTDYFLPQMQQAGFDGHYTNKASSTREGEATFFRTSRLRVAARQDVVLKDCFRDLLQPPADSTAAQHAQRHARFEPMLRSSPQLQQVLQGVATVAQMTLLQPVSQIEGTTQQPAQLAPKPDNGRPALDAALPAEAVKGGHDGSNAVQGNICVVNSHFFFHPRASHVRNIHAAALMSEVEAFVSVPRNRLSSSNIELATAASAADAGSTAVIRAPQSNAESEGLGSHQEAAQEPALLFCGDLNSDFNDGTPGMSADKRSSDTKSPAFMEVDSASNQLATVLFCGDLNCGLNHGTPGVVQLLNSGKLPRDFWDWDFSADFTWGPDAEEEGGGEAAPAAEGAPASVPPQAAAQETAGTSGRHNTAPVNGIDVSIPFKLRSADELQSPFTNYVRGYSGLLDYIWYEPHRLKVDRAIPLPGLTEVQDFIPSQRFPSDHLSVVYDFSWQQPSASSDQLTASQPTTPAANLVLPEQAASAAITPSRSAYPIAALLHNMQRAVSALGDGHVIAVPTDTLYGLAADANSSAGIQRIYSIKNRQAHAPLAICIADVEDLQRYCDTQHLPQQLLQQLLPGPVTLILSRRQQAPLCAELNPGLLTIGVRIPESDFIRGVCRQHGGAIALTSANLSGATSPLCVNDFAPLWASCAAVFNGLRINADRAGSTVVDLSQKAKFKIVRPGVSLSEVRTLLLEQNLLEQT